MKPCDFCGLPVTNNINRYDAERMVSIALDADSGEFLDNLLENDDGVWFACKTCSILIDAEKWEELIERILTLFQQRDPVAWDDAVALNPRFRAFLREVVESQYLILKDSIRKHKEN